MHQSLWESIHYISELLCILNVLKDRDTLIIVCLTNNNGSSLKNLTVDWLRQEENRQTDSHADAVAYFS